MKVLSQYILVTVGLIVLILNYFDTCCARYYYRSIFFLGLLIYFFKLRQFNKLLYGFLLVFTISEGVSGLTFLHHYFGEIVFDYTFYVCNILYITAYVFLLFDVIKRLTSKALKKYWFSGFILLCLGVYLWYSTMVLGLFSNVNSWMTFYDNLLIMIYMLIVVLIFSMTVLNFIINPYNKFILFSLGVVCITFSEIISAASILNFLDPVTSSLSLGFMLIGFCLIFFNKSTLSRIIDTKKIFKC